MSRLLDIKMLIFRYLNKYYCIISKYYCSYPRIFLLLNQEYLQYKQTLLEFGTTIVSTHSAPSSIYSNTQCKWISDLWFKQSDLTWWWPELWGEQCKHCSVTLYKTFRVVRTVLTLQSHGIYLNEIHLHFHILYL